LALVLADHIEKFRLFDGDAIYLFMALSSLS